jgi:hypothetical protein
LAPAFVSIGYLFILRSQEGIEFCRLFFIGIDTVAEAEIVERCPKCFGKALYFRYVPRALAREPVLHGMPGNSGFSRGFGRRHASEIEIKLKLLP